MNNYLNIHRILKKHNNIIVKMNKEINKQIILSLNENERSLHNNLISRINDETNDVRIEILTNLNSYSSLDENYESKFESESESESETESESESESESE